MKLIYHKYEATFSKPHQIRNIKPTTIPTTAHRGISDFQKAIAEGGFNFDAHDWADVHFKTSADGSKQIEAVVSVNGGDVLPCGAVFEIGNIGAALLDQKSS
jgi:hypothetical protein